MALASKFQYKARTAEQVEKRLSRTSGSFQGFLHDDYKLFKPAAGDNLIRFMPPTWDDAEHWGMEVHVHYNVGPERASVLCNAKMFGKKCPICEAQAAARKAGDEELAKELGERTQVVSWIVDMKDTSKGPQLYSIGFRMDSDFIKLTRDRESGEIYQIDNPEEGYNVSFQREGTGLTTKYSGYQLGRKASSIQADWLAYVVEHPLPEVLVHRDYDEVKKLFEGNDAAGEDDDKPDAAAKAPMEDKPKFVSRVKTPPKPAEPEPEEATEEAQADEPEAETPAETIKPKANVAAAASGMSAADKLRVKLAARKAK